MLVHYLYSIAIAPKFQPIGPRGQDTEREVTRPGWSFFNDEHRPSVSPILDTYPVVIRRQG